MRIVHLPLWRVMYEGTYYYVAARASDFAKETWIRHMRTKPQAVGNPQPDSVYMLSQTIIVGLEENPKGEDTHY